MRFAIRSASLFPEDEHMTEGFAPERLSALMRSFLCLSLLWEIRAAEAERISDVDL